MKRTHIRIPKILRNKFVVASLAFVVWVCFINDIDLFYIIKTRNELVALRTELQELRAAQTRSETELYNLKHNTRTLEKFARERYFMKKDNEEIFVFREKAD